MSCPSAENNIGFMHPFGLHHFVHVNFSFIRGSRAAVDVAGLALLISASFEEECALLLSTSSAGTVHSQGVKLTSFIPK